MNDLADMELISYRNFQLKSTHVTKVSWTN